MTKEHVPTIHEYCNDFYTIDCSCGWDGYWYVLSRKNAIEVWEKHVVMDEALGEV